MLHINVKHLPYSWIKHKSKWKKKQPPLQPNKLQRGIKVYTIITKPILLVSIVAFPLTEGVVGTIFHVITLTIISSMVVFLLIIIKPMLEADILIFVGVTPFLTLNRRATMGNNKAVAGHRTTLRILGKDNDVTVVGLLFGSITYFVIILLFMSSLTTA
jgi:hypothetical protein